MAAPRLVGLPGSGAWALLARCLLHGREVPGLPAPAFKGPLVLVVKEQEELEDVSDAFAALAPLFGDEAQPAALFGEDARVRLSSLELLRGGARLAVVLPQALAQAVPSREEFSGGVVSFSIGLKLKREAAIERLISSGYQRVDFVESPGEFAVRGAVLDFFGLEPLQVVRVLFDEDEIASLRTFEPGTQATLALVHEAKAVPAAEEGAAGLLSEWLCGDALWIAPEDVEFSPPSGAALFKAGRLLELSADDLDFGARPVDPTRGDPRVAWKQMRRAASEGRRVVLYSLNRGEDRRMQELLEEQLPPGLCQFLIGPLRQGFDHAGLKLCVLATSEIFGRHYRPAARWKHFTSKGGLNWRELRQGDFVVHQDYGVSRYRGLKPVESPGHGTLDCLLLEFRGEDRLYAPMTEFGRIQKYSGAEGKRPRLSSLDTRRWEEVKRQVREGVRELAEQLLKTQAARAALPGNAFPEDSPMEREFAEAFPYEETQDQARAISEVCADMASPHPMDRLVIGDVGYGKTEVAMRAAFKCAAGFKQTMVLVPTTILADQHFRTFTARFADYPVKLGLLTRFQTPAEQKAVAAALKEGKLDIVIGTARLLQKDVSFKDLGLVIVDEEHRFGVKDKERVKQIRKAVDLLSLSATPIPRTLNQALSGLRGISLIESAPTGRQPIVTKVGPWNEEAVQAAISEELARGGQAYYVHNRVRSMGDSVGRLRKILPTARFGMVHGKMSAADIEKSMWEFFNRKFDVLVASTIIESGLDIPWVNTLLVEDAHEFGLAQLYQLRGRIGREKQRAYCYFFFPEGTDDLKALSEDARKRLEALKEFGELGAGIKLAMRDLEIRGAGDLLGARQHGFMNAVGVEFYSQLLDEEIARKAGRSSKDDVEPVTVDIKLPAYIPESYLPDEMHRLEFYKRILRSKPEDIESLRRELEDLSGPAPEPVRHLFTLLRVRALAQKAGLRSATQKDRRIEIYFRKDAPIGHEVLSSWVKTYQSQKLMFVPSPEGDGLVVELERDEPLEWLEAFLAGILGGDGGLEKMVR
ncbi:MAG: transcription-repair coupling factor [Elusimicrobia bacterium]|nr:transcription-repair coupling factor [Elusimicrobiota bacterium]